MNTKTLKDLFLDELADMYDAEKRLIKALPKMAKAATCTHLKAIFVKHLEETRGQVATLEKVFGCFEMKPKGKTCEATKGLIEEADEIASDFKGSPAINAALISAAQKVEHYEMASYGCLHEWAALIENQKAAGLLEGILKEESAANQALNKLAVSRSNQEALCDSSDSCDSYEILPKAKSKIGGASALRRGIRPLVVRAR